MVVAYNFGLDLERKRSKLDLGKWTKTESVGRLVMFAKVESVKELVTIKAAKIVEISEFSSTV